MQGLRREDVGVYLNGKSNDFVEAATAIAVFGRHKLAVATGSDPLEYDLPGQNRETHILGPDLAAALIDMCVPSRLELCIFWVLGLPRRAAPCQCFPNPILTWQQNQVLSHS